MIIRIVKMSFDSEKIKDFLENFEKNRQQIQNAPGNRFLELYQDQNNCCIFFTYSHWETAQDLENYRQSALFKEVWSFTKKRFNEKPEAWTLSQK